MIYTVTGPIEKKDIRKPCGKGIKIESYYLKIMIFTKNPANFLNIE